MNKWLTTIVMSLFVLCYARLASATDAWIDCEGRDFHSHDKKDTGNPNTRKKEKNFRDKGDWMRWEIEAPANTRVIVEPTTKQDYDGTQTLGTTPFEGTPPYEFIIPAPGGEKEKLRLKANLADGAYGYKITCKYADGRADTVIDPIIEVPRGSSITPQAPPPPSPQTQTQPKD